MKKQLKKLFSVAATAAMIASAVLPAVAVTKMPSTNNSPAVAKTASIGEIDLSYSQNFNIARPAGSAVATTTTYYITGTSDPSQPLYYHDTVVEQTATGLWGLLVEVPVGTSYYTFTQGGVEKTVSLTRYGSGGSANKISAITQGSMTPAKPAYAQVGQEFKLSCVAPASASVTANIGGYTVELKQVAVASEGIPATFTGSFYLPEVLVGTKEVVDLGKVTYTLNYNGNTTTFNSTSSLYGVGTDAYVVVEVKDYLIGITKDATSQNSGNFITSVGAGTRDYVYDQTSTHFILYSGGAILKDSVNILTGERYASASANSLEFSSDSKTETYRIVGGASALTYASLDDNAFTLEMKNTSGTTGWISTSSTLFSGIYEEALSGNSVKFTFTLNSPGVVWGYNIEHSGSDLLVTIKKVPSLSSSSSRPLEGITVVLDPGHGGIDPGALGVAGAYGPDEADVNMALTLATKQALEEKGATVVLTRASRKQAKNVLFERMKISDDAQPDFFISIHHNSTGVNKDSTNSSGTEVYYYNGNSAALAKNISSGVSAAAGRPNRGAVWSYYVVTKTTYCPSVLAEIGFMVSPKEYESVTNTSTIYASAEAIANAVVETLKQSIQSL